MDFKNESFAHTLSDFKLNRLQPHTVGLTLFARPSLSLSHSKNEMKQMGSVTSFFCVPFSLLSLSLSSIFSYSNFHSQNTLPIAKYHLYCPSDLHSLLGLSHYTTHQFPTPSPNFVLLEIIFIGYKSERRERWNHRVHFVFKSNIGLDVNTEIAGNDCVKAEDPQKNFPCFKKGLVD